MYDINFIDDEIYTQNEQINIKENIKMIGYSDTTFFEPIDKSEEYHFLKFKKIMGNHNESDGNYTAEFIKEVFNDVEDKCRFISGGTNKRLKIYYSNYKENKDIEITDIRDWTYSINEREEEKEKLEFIACANKEVHRVGLDDTFDFHTYEMPYMTSVASLEMKVLKKDKNNKKNEIKDILIIVGRGVLGLYNIFRENNESNELRHLQIVKDKAYRGIIKLTEAQIALTSNEIIPYGENNLIIYNLFQETLEKEINNYSFTASANALQVIKNEKDDSNVLLLCGCKKYSQNYENGILLVELNNDTTKGKYETKLKNIEKEFFFPTQDFEVYCFCLLKIRPRKDNILVNDKFDHLTFTNYFLVGGFDNKNYEGKIKLFKLIKENNKKRIKFMQDVDICDDYSENCDKFDGFCGAVSSIIQARENGDILASCYDGKIYIFSEPNLALYNKKFIY